MQPERGCGNEVFMKLKKIIACLVVMLCFALSFTACGKCEAHKDKNDDGKCDACEMKFTDGCDDLVCIDKNGDNNCDNKGCDKATSNRLCTHKDADDDKICDDCGKAFADGCDNHRDANDNGECDVAGCGEAFTDGCDKVACLDGDGDGKCDKCGEETSSQPCLHADADDNKACDECGIPFTDGCDNHRDADDNGECDVAGCDETFADGCDVTACLDTDGDGKCNNAGCEKETLNKPCLHRDADEDCVCDDCTLTLPKCEHKDKNDDGKCDGCTADFLDGCDAALHADVDDNEVCDACGAPFTDGCDNHVDADDNGECDVAGCGEAFTDGCDNHRDADDDGKCDICDNEFFDFCESHKDENDDYVCDTAGCGVVIDDGNDVGDYRVKEKYFPEEISDILYTEFEAKSQAFVRMSGSAAPFSSLDVYNLSDCRVLSVVIPIRALKDADENGNFVFTIYKVGNTREDLSKKPIDTYEIKINKDEFGLTPGDTSVYKTVTVDLRGYNIALTDKQTLAFGSETDTVVPAYIHADEDNDFEISKAFDEHFPRGIGVLKNVGEGFSSDNPTLCFDLELERSYESETAYNEMIAAEERYEREYAAVIEQLKEIYKGKRVSVLGDSISTFDGISNNTSYNMTLTNRGTCQYPRWDDTVSYVTDTYWGRLITELDMELCVDNAWSGTHIYGSSKNEYQDSAVVRATELHRDNGTTTRSDDVDPDLIILYMGVNDMDGGKNPFGDLINILKKNDGRSDNEKIEAWFANVLTRYKKYGVVAGTTYTAFDQAYALTLYRMLEKYPNAELICMTYVRNLYSTLNDQKVADYCRVVSAIATYFGATVADQSGPLAELTYENIHLNATRREEEAVHPNRMGHEMMERLIIKTLAEKHGIELPTK